MKARVHTNIGFKYFKQPISIQEELIANNNVYKIDHKNYIIKAIYNNDFYGRSKELIRVYEEYFLMKAASCLNQYLIKPLCLDYKIEGGSSIYIEMLFECKGVILNELKLTTNVVYNLMRQSIQGLYSLKNISTAPLVIRHDNMIHDEEMNVLKFVDIGNAFCSKYKVVTDYESKSVYLWAKCFYFIITNNMNAKCGVKDLAASINKNLELLNPNEVNIKEFIKRILINALTTKVTIKQILNNMKDFEQINSLKFIDSYINTREQLMIKYDDCENCVGEIYKKVELKCKHMICKDCLIQYSLKSFIKRKPYNHCCLCLTCKEIKQVKLFTLDCYCTWTSAKFKNSYSNKVCNHNITFIDLCIIKDYISFKNTSVMLSDYIKEKKVPNLLELHKKALHYEDMETITWILKNTQAITHLELLQRKIKDIKIPRKTTLTQLTLKNCSIDNKSLETIGNVLKVNTTIMELNIIRVCIQDEGAKIISKFLKVNKTLIQLKLESNGIEINGLMSIYEALRSNNTLKKLSIRKNDNIAKLGYIYKLGNRVEQHNNNILIELDLEGNQTTPFYIYKSLSKLSLVNNLLRNKDIEDICRALKKNKSLKELIVRKNNLHHESIEVICKIMGTLKQLDLGFNCLVKYDAKLISKALETNESLIQLNLKHNRIQDIEKIGEALKLNKTLKQLNLTKNDIKDPTAISNALKANRSLLALNLGNNKINNEGAKVIADMLILNESLMKLNIRSNRIGDEGVRFLGEALKINKALKSLNIWNNNITNITIIGEVLKINKSLIRLNLGHNKISDASTIGEGLKVNESLQYLNLRSNKIRNVRVITEALASNKSLKVLDLARNKIDNEGISAITNTSLIQFKIEKNKGVIKDAIKGNKTLQKLSTSCMDIKDVKVINEMLEFNKITQIDVHYKGHNIKTKRLLLDLLEVNVMNHKNMKEDREVIGEAFKLINNGLDMRYINIGYEGAKLIIEKLNVNVKELTLFNTNLGEEGIDAICEALKYNEAIKVLALRGGSVSCENGKSLGEVLKMNKALIDISFGFFKLRSKFIKYLSEGLKANTTLEKLNLDDNCIGIESGEPISKALKCNESLLELSLYSNRLGIKGVRFISEALKVNRTLKRLNLNRNLILDEGVKAISQALKYNKALTHLDVIRNGIKASGGMFIGSALKVNKTLIYLNIADSKIGSAGAIDIAKALEINKSLKHLNLANNEIRSEGFRAIGTALKVNTTLTELILALNRPNFESIKVISEALIVSRTLEELSLNNCLIEYRGISAISKGLMKNKSLVKLNLSNSEMKDIKTLSKALSVNRTLKLLEIWNTKISKEDKDILEKLFNRVKFDFYVY